MTRTFSTSECDEVPKNVEAAALALLRVELHGEDVSPAHRRREAAAVGGGRDDVVVAAAHVVVTVHEVEVGAGIDAGEQWRRGRGDDLVPTDVRHPLAIGRDEPAYVALDPAQAG